MAVFQSWKKANATAKERIAFLFNNEVLSDVHLVVRSSSDENDAKKSKLAIPAHKFVLSSCSPVFFAMFCGEMAENSHSIDLPDCEYEAVLEMLRYMYSEEVALTESNVIQVLYVAKKYLLSSLVDECVVFLQRHLDSANVFCVLLHAQQFDESSLVGCCWGLIDSDTGDALKSEVFAGLQRSLLEDIVRRDSLNITEVELFKAVDLWATKECERQGLAVEGKAKRTVLGEQLLKQLRFPAMGEKEFASVVVDCNILTKEEVGELMNYFNGVLTTPVTFSEVNRTGSLQSCCRFGSFFSVTHSEDYRWCDDVYEQTTNIDGSPVLNAIKVWVDKDVKLHGFRYLGSKNIDYGLFMKIKDQTQETLLNVKRRIFSSYPFCYKEDEIIYGFDIVFNPLVLTKNRVYTVIAYVYGQEPCYGCDGVSTVECSGVTFHFKDCYSRENEECVHSGQFAELFFKPM